VKELLRPGKAGQLGSSSPLIVMIWCVFLVVAVNLESGNAQDTFVQKDRSTFTAVGTEQRKEVERNTMRFRIEHPAIWQISREAIADLKTIGLRRIRTAEPVRGIGERLIDPASFLAAVRDAKRRSWEKLVTASNETYIVRVTVIPLSKGGGLSASRALAHLRLKYHTASSFHDKPNFLTNTVKETAEHDSIYYEQDVWTYRFATQELFETKEAALECFYWPLRQNAAGIDVAMFVPTANNTVSDIVFFSVYRDPDRRAQAGDVRNQHEALLRALRLDNRM
jgi:hypothetical protein